MKLNGVMEANGDQLASCKLNAETVHSVIIFKKKQTKKQLSDFSSLLRQKKSISTYFF